MSKVEMYRAGLKVLGKKKRARKAKHHTIELGRVHVKFDEQALKKNAQAELSAHFKEWDKAWVQLDYVTVEGDIERWSPFDEHTEKMKRLITL